MLLFKLCYKISASLVKYRSEMNAVSFFETLGRTHIKRHKTKTPTGYFYIIKRTLSWNYLPKSLFQLKNSPWILKSVSLETHSPAPRITIFTSALAMTLRIGARAEMWFSSPGEYAVGKNCFLLLDPSGDRKRKPKQQHLLWKDQRLTAKGYGRLTWSGRGSRTARHRPARKHRSHVTANPVPGHSLESLLPWANLVFISSQFCDTPSPPQCASHTSHSSCWLGRTEHGEWGTEIKSQLSVATEVRNSLFPRQVSIFSERDWNTWRGCPPLKS